MKIIQIGITGHRILAQSNDQEIELGIVKALSKIAVTFPFHTFKIISALAEGADCLFVEKALDHLKAQLIVVLPLRNNEYLEDFTSDRARKIFITLLQKSTSPPILITEQETREIAYLKAGEFIVDHCDILIAIWDGKLAQGLGGTGQIVDLARRNKKSLIWILAGNRQPGTHNPTRLRKDQGLVRFEHFPKMGSYDESLY